MDRIIQINCLGRMGRFGNQLFQYAFARAYAEQHDAILETPPWPGQKLFGLNDPLPSRLLPATPLDEAPPDGRVNIDLFGFFIKEGRGLNWTVDQVRQWFTFDPAVVRSFPLRQGDYVAVHMRRGDFTQLLHRTCIVRHASYEAALRRNGFDPKQASWVAEEKGQPMFQDFITLARAKVLFMSNSTFSYWAGLLGGSRCFAPLCEGQTGWIDCDFVEGHRYIRKWANRQGP